jgi:glutamyl-tRNA reductase
MSGTPVAVGASHTTLALPLRERIALSPELAARGLEELGRHEAVGEAAILSTCNRTELHIVAADAAAAEAIGFEFLTRRAGRSAAQVRSGLYALRGPDAVRHLFRVAAGLESMVVGEVEIQGQVRRAYEHAEACGAIGPIGRRLFSDALGAGRRARSATGISRSRVSLSSIAVELAGRALGELDGRRALVIGSGKGGELAARALAEVGVGVVCVASRRRSRAAGLAARFGGVPVDLDAVARELHRADVVVSCTASPRPVLRTADLVDAARGGRRDPLVIVDMAVPRDVEQSAAALCGVVLHDLDDLQREVAHNTGLRQGDAARAGDMIDHDVERFGDWLAGLDVVPTIAALRERGRETVEQLMRENESRWRGLLDEDRERVEVLASSVVSRLLHEPTMRLKTAARSDSSDEYTRVLRELFALDAATR